MIALIRAPIARARSMVSRILNPLIHLASFALLLTHPEIPSAPESLFAARTISFSSGLRSSAIGSGIVLHRTADS